MERLIYWTLFAAGVVLAAWLPAKSVYPELGRVVAHRVAVAVDRCPLAPAENRLTLAVEAGEKNPR